MCINVGVKTLLKHSFKDFRYHLPIADKHRNFHRQLKECKKSNKQSPHIFELIVIEMK